MNEQAKNAGNFFVMLTTSSGGYTPLNICNSISDNTIELAKFKTYQDAVVGAKESVLGDMFGFEIFQIGCGC